jgi:transcriptional regulator with XRE-family HTH domain
MKMADLLDSSTGYIGQIEIGARFPSIEIIQKMAEVLQIAPHLLFMDEAETDKLIRDVPPLPPRATLTPAAREELIARLQAAVRRVVERG